MFNNMTLKATMRAEKDKQILDKKMAGRYVKIRALLDSAEKAIGSSNVARILKNTLNVKLSKARRALDFNSDVEQVSENLAIIITMLNQEIKGDQMAIDSIESEMRRDLDMFYNYDFDKFVEEEKNERGRYLAKFKGALSRLRARHFKVKSTSSLVERRNENSTNDNATGEIESAKSDKNESDTGKVNDNYDVDSISIEEIWTVDKTLETLTLSLNVLRVLPDLVLNDTQNDLLVETLKATKPLLVTPEGCAALTAPFKMLHASIDNATDGVPVEPSFSQALVAMCIAIATHRQTKDKSMSMVVEP